MQKIIIFVLMLFISTTTAMADSASQIEQKAQNKYQYELSRCAVFYEVLSGCLSDEDSQKKEITDLSKETIQQAMAYGVQIKMKTDAIMSRLRQERASLISDMKGQCSNYQVIVQNNYSNCIKVSKIGPKRLMYWRHKVRETATENTQP